MKRNIHVVSQFIASIGEVTNDLIKGLQPYYNITREGFQDPIDYDIILCHFINPVITKHVNFEKFKHKVLIQPIDGTSIKKEIIREINKFDIIITPGNAGKNIMIQNGVTKPIKVIPNFYLPEDIICQNNYKFISRKIHNKIYDKFMFYHESTCHERKGVKELLKVYIDTFSSNEKKESKLKTILVIKSCVGQLELKELKNYYKELQSVYKFPAEILIINNWLKKEQLCYLMKNCNCYVQPSKIEGFGIPLLRALVNQKQTIVIENEYSGYMDFVKQFNLATLFCEGVPCIAVGEKNPIYDKDTIWKTPKLDSLGYNLFFSTTRKQEIVLDLQILTKQKEFKDNLFLYSLENIINQYRKVFDSSYLSNNQQFLESKLETSEVRVKYYFPRGNSGYSQAAKDYIIGLSSQVPLTVKYLIFDQTNYIDGLRNELVNSLINKENINYNKVIIHSTPEHWDEIIKEEKELNPHAEIIGMTVWETSKLDPRWVDWINQVDKVIVPCNWNKEVFKECGVIKPIEVIPHIYKPLVKNTAYINGLNNEDYVFYTIGQWSNRKGIDDTLIAYLNEFTNKDKTCLIIKTFANDYSEEQKQIIRNRVNSIVRLYENPAKIILLLDEMTDDEIAALHNKGNCYVSLAKAEGFGLGMFDAAGNENPVISTNYGGQLDFLQHDFLVDYDLIPVEGMEWVPWYNKDQQWAKPNIKKASKYMRYVYEKRDKEVIYAKLNASKIQQFYNTSNIINKLINFLKK